MRSFKYMHVPTGEEKSNLSNPVYSLVIKREKMINESKNPYFQGGKVDYAQDARSESGADQLFMDAQRDILINGKSAKYIPHLEGFKQWLKETADISNDNIQKLEQHYSQNPRIFGANYVHAYYGTPIIDNGIAIRAPDTKEMFIEENGELYFHIQHEDYPVWVADERDDYTQLTRVRSFYANNLIAESFNGSIA